MEAMYLAFTVSAGGARNAICVWSLTRMLRNAFASDAEGQWKDKPPMRQMACK